MGVHVSETMTTGSHFSLPTTLKTAKASMDDDANKTYPPDAKVTEDAVSSAKPFMVA